MTLIPKEETIHCWYNQLPRKTQFLIISGAGISVSAGLPTFIQSPSPRAYMEDLFNWHTVVERQTQPQRDMFLQYTAEMRHQVLCVEKPTVFHAWVQHSHRRIGLWLSFNIDGLENELCTDEQKQRLNRKIVRGHGSLNMLRCNACQETIPYGNNEIQHILKYKTLPHLQCRAQNKRMANRQCWFRPTVTLYGADPESQYHTAAIVQRVNQMLHRLRRRPTTTTMESKKKSSVKLVLVLAGLSLRMHEMRAFIQSVAKQVSQLENAEVVWVNPATPYKSIIPYVTKIVATTADEFATQCQKAPCTTTTSNT